MKTCKKCGSEFAEARCKPCLKQYKAEWREKNRDKWNSYFAKWASKNPEKANTYSPAAKERRRKAAVAWRSENKEQVLVFRKRSRLKRAAQRRLESRRYYATHKDKVLARSIQYHKEHPEIYANRRAREQSGALSKGLTKRLFALQKGRCACCGLPLLDKYHLDHRMPLALGGANEDWNMQLLRAPCNLSKGKTDPIVFMQKRGFLL